MWTNEAGACDTQRQVGKPVGLARGERGAGVARRAQTRKDTGKDRNGGHNNVVTRRTRGKRRPHLGVLDARARADYRVAFVLQVKLEDAVARPQRDVELRPVEDGGNDAAAHKLGLGAVTAWAGTAGRRDVPRRGERRGGRWGAVGREGGGGKRRGRRRPGPNEATRKTAGDALADDPLDGGGRLFQDGRQRRLEHVAGRLQVDGEEGGKALRGDKVRRKLGLQLREVGRVEEGRQLVRDLCARAGGVQGRRGEQWAQRPERPPRPRPAPGAGTPRRAPASDTARRGSQSRIRASAPSSPTDVEICRRCARWVESRRHASRACPRAPLRNSAVASVAAVAAGARANTSSAATSSAAETTRVRAMVRANGDARRGVKDALHVLRRQEKPPRL